MRAILEGFIEGLQLAFALIFHPVKTMRVTMAGFIYTISALGSGAALASDSYWIGACLAAISLGAGSVYWGMRT